MIIFPNIQDKILVSIYDHKNNEDSLYNTEYLNVYPHPVLKPLLYPVLNHITQAMYIHSLKRTIPYSQAEIQSYPPYFHEESHLLNQSFHTYYDSHPYITGEIHTCWMQH